MIRSPNQPNSETSLTCELPLGLAAKGKRERRAVLRKSGEELQLRLLALDFGLPRERALSQALAICVEQIGSVQEPSAKVMEELTLNDRHALVHALLLAGDTAEISGTAICASCSRKLVLTLDLRAVRLPKIPDSGAVVLSRPGKTRRDRRELRIPAAKELAQASDEASLLGLCLGCTPIEAKRWMSAAEKVLSRLDPLSHLEILGQCIDCHARVRAEIDPGAYWLSALRAGSANLLQDIHRLALRYHWTEKEILGLPEVRRQAYLDLSWGEPTEAPNTLARGM